MAPAGGTMMGVSRTISAGKTSEWEFLIIREGANGLEYVAKPSRQAETIFTAAKASAGEVAFENPAHDFPKRITYKRDGDTLTAAIEGPMNGQNRRNRVPVQKSGLRRLAAADFADDAEETHRPRTSRTTRKKHIGRGLRGRRGRNTSAADFADDAEETHRPRISRMTRKKHIGRGFRGGRGVDTSAADFGGRPERTDSQTASSATSCSQRLMNKGVSMPE
jgi:hypothetical protein